MPVALQMIKKSLLTLVLIASIAGFTSKTGSTSPFYTVVSVDPKISSGSAGTTVTINITVTNVTDLYSYDGNLTYNPTILNCTSCAEGPFLGTAGMTWWVPPTIDNYNGYVFFGNTLWGAPYASGNGTLAIITFDVLVEGRTPLNFSLTDLNFQDDEGVAQDILHDTENGVFTIPGDVNGGGTVDLYDIALIGEGYGKTQADPDWNAHKVADITGSGGVPDGAVDTYDLALCDANYGNTA